MEDIRVDADALGEEIKKQAKESGLIVTAYMPGVKEEDLQNNGSLCPIVTVEGHISPITAAFMVNALEATIEQLKERPMVKLLSEGLKMFSTSQTITVDKEKEND